MHVCYNVFIWKYLKHGKNSKMFTVVASDDRIVLPLFYLQYFLFANVLYKLVFIPIAKTKHRVFHHFKYLCEVDN